MNEIVNDNMMGSEEKRFFDLYNVAWDTASEADQVDILYPIFCRYIQHGYYDGLRQSVTRYLSSRRHTDHAGRQYYRLV